MLAGDDGYSEGTQLDEHDQSLSPEAVHTAEQSRRQIAFIVNPASGVNRSAVETIQAFMAEQKTHLASELHLTKADGDATRFAQAAVARKVDLVAAYGGDGTMMEVATGLMGSDVPMLMLPGGTANVMAVDMGIPVVLEDALALALVHPPTLREVDMGVIDNEHFLLRAGIGYEAEMSASAERGEKSKRGRWAYVENALNKMRKLRPSQYILTIDGEVHVREGITCMICNSSSIGIPNLRFVHNGSISDGYLDVIVIRNMHPSTLIRTIFHILRSTLPSEESGAAHVDHWQAKEVTVQMKRRQFVARDGEPMKRSKRVSAHIIPSAVKIIIPAPVTPAEEPADEPTA
jgi:YegS/Rv2252/BmrU family lipid kinase